MVLFQILAVHVILVFVPIVVITVRPIVDAVLVLRAFVVAVLRGNGCGDEGRNAKRGNQGKARECFAHHHGLLDRRCSEGKTLANFPERPSRFSCVRLSRLLEGRG
jgi:hypothetical protein